jgi:hypothetical protein
MAQDYYQDDYGRPPERPNIPNYLAQAILVTLCCCIPFGVVAIVYAAQVNSKLQVGDVAGAEAASKQAKMFCWLGFGLGLPIVIIGGLIQFFAAMQQAQIKF